MLIKPIKYYKIGLQKSLFSFIHSQISGQILALVQIQTEKKKILLKMRQRLLNRSQSRLLQFFLKLEEEQKNGKKAADQ